MNQLVTCWAKQDLSWQEYPRPLKRRNSFINLNGEWDYCIQDHNDIHSIQWQGKIRVPFAIESTLSMVQKPLLPGQYLVYKKEFKNPLQTSGHLILHFDGVDQRCKVYINKVLVKKNTMGYLPFEVDITKQLQQTNEILVVVQDDTDRSYHSRGKQTLQPKGMFYTATSGIWKSVWMEVLPEQYIQDVLCFADADCQRVTFEIKTLQEGNWTLDVFEPFIDSQVTLSAEECKKEFVDTDSQEYKEKSIVYSKQSHSKYLMIDFKDIKLWSCEKPYLYYFRVRFGKDEVVSYFAFRTFTIEKSRINLNHVPYFQKGLLDQGYWPDGGMSAPSDKALVYDILKMKELGFNMLRKHIKVEMDRFYYHCDRLGMIVWQDMVCGGSKYKLWFVAYAATFLNRFNMTISDSNAILLSRTDKKGRVEFEKEMKKTILSLDAHPSIACWVLFNEGWGQFDTKRLSAKIKKLDPTRIVDASSGWFDQGCGDLKSHHHYFLKRNLVWEKNRATVLSEFGGYPFAIKNHTYSEAVYGYHKVRSLKELQKKYNALMLEIEEEKKKGLSASVYTQLSDVEEEVNGILTFDREVCKLNKG